MKFSDLKPNEYFSFTTDRLIYQKTVEIRKDNGSWANVIYVKDDGEVVRFFVDNDTEIVRVTFEYEGITYHEDEGKIAETATVSILDLPVGACFNDTDFKIKDDVYLHRHPSGFYSRVIVYCDRQVTPTRFKKPTNATLKLYDEVDYYQLFSKNYVDNVFYIKIGLVVYEIKDNKCTRCENWQQEQDGYYVWEY